MFRNSVLGRAAMKSRLCAVSAAALLLVAMGSGDAARAAFVAAICNDATCSGSNDFFVTDNGTGDVAAAPGAIIFLSFRRLLWIFLRLEFFAK